MLPWLQNHGALQEGILRLPIKFNQPPPNSNLPGRLIFRIIQISVEFLDQGHIDATIRLSGQGLVPLPSLELFAELVILHNKNINFPLRKDVPGVNILLITLPSDLGNKSGSIVWFSRSGGSCFPLPRGHRH